MKKQFDWDRFKNEKIVVHCKTEEEAKDFCREMHEHGMKWCGGAAYLEHTNYSNYKEKTCYAANGCFCDYDFFAKKRYTILEWSDYMQKEFTKADLKDGMIVEQADEERYLVVGDRVLSLDGFNQLSQYENNLTNSKFGEEYGIEKVFKVRNNCVNSLEEIFKDENLELIWERKETKRMTAEEMRQKLEEFTREKIKVEPSREEMIGACYQYCDNMRFCKGCVIAKMCSDCGDLFTNYCDEELKQCYEKVMENGK